MTTSSTAIISEADFSAIEDALQSTEKGRRFLRAYVSRNRGVESLRLLRSISRLHRASLGAPGANAEICRDLTSILRSAARQRQIVLQSELSAAARCGILLGSLEEIESCLLALIESLEERSLNSLYNDQPPLTLAGATDADANRVTKLFGELSSLFAGEQQHGAGN
ncbi:MAG: hypothetical protein WBX25_04980 [Rhodomicrobium sp.]